MNHNQTLSQNEIEHLKDQVRVHAARAYQLQIAIDQAIVMLNAGNIGQARRDLLNSKRPVRGVK
ncbi:MAG: hypothetical protein ACPGMR_11540 [Pontibacterium sp.]